MKKFCIISILLLSSFLANRAFADDLGLGDSTPFVDNAWYGQKPVTDEEFEKTITKLKEKKYKTSKKKKRQGQSLNKIESTEHEIKALTDKTLLLTLPVELITADGQEIPTGHYNVTCRKVKNKIYMDFRQAHSLVATVEAVETNNDFDEPTINFVKLHPYDETRVEVIYGSLDFNAVTLINIKNSLN